MKKRNGFVSNSSSSSFVLSCPKSETADDKIMMTMKVNIQPFVTEKIETKEDLDTYYIEECAYTEGDTLEKIFEVNDWLKDRYYNMLNQINLGNILLIGHVYSDSGGYISGAIYENGLKDLDPPFKIVENTEE